MKFPVDLTDYNYRLSSKFKFILLSGLSGLSINPLVYDSGAFIVIT